GFRGGHELDVHAADLVHPVVNDFREDDLFLQAHGEVAAAIETLAGDAAEVANTRHGNGHQTVEELIHPRPAKGDLAADRQALADLESGNGLLGDGFNRAL